MPTVQLIILGKVQGVLFRNQTKKLADQLNIKGYVKNLSNGSVEIIAQGDKEKIEQLENWAKIGPKLAKVDKLISNKIESNIHYTEFSIEG